MRNDYALAAILGLFTCSAACSDGSASRDPVSPPANDPPILDAQPDTTGAVGDTLRLTARATDPDGDDILYGLTVIVSLAEIELGYAADISIDGATGEMWFVPSTDDRPSRSFRFRAFDGNGGEAEQPFTVFTD